MNFEDAIRQSIKSYYKGIDPENLNATKENPPVYTREYFDELEEELLGRNKKKEDKEDIEGDEDGS